MAVVVRSTRTSPSNSANTDIMRNIIRPAAEVVSIFSLKLGPFIGHLEEQQEGKLLQVVTIAQALVSQDITVVP
jgi:hypothetical protein